MVMDGVFGHFGLDGSRAFPSSHKHTSVLKYTALKVIYKGCFKSFVALYADRICSDQHFIENRIEKFLFV